MARILYDGEGKRRFENAGRNMEKYGKSFKELNNTEKVEFILEYYKFHIIGGLVGLVVIFSLLNHYVFNPPKPVIVDVTITAPYADPAAIEELQTEIKRYVEEKTGSQTAQVEALYFSDKNDPQTQMVMTTKLIGKATTGELDILVLDKDHLEYFKENEMLLPLTDYWTEQEVALYAEQTITAQKDGGDIPVALALPESSRLGKLLPQDFQGYLAVYAKARDIELVKELLPMLLQQ